MGLIIPHPKGFPTVFPYDILNTPFFWGMILQPPFAPSEDDPQVAEGTVVIVHFSLLGEGFPGSFLRVPQGVLGGVGWVVVSHKAFLTVHNFRNVTQRGGMMIFFSGLGGHGLFLEAMPVLWQGNWKSLPS